MTIRQSIYQQEILPMAELLFGALLRILQALLQGAPFILSGICITALLERMLGLKDTKRLFGSNSIISLFQSWCIGMALPGCSLGVIPICHQMRAALRAEPAALAGARFIKCHDLLAARPIEPVPAHANGRRKGR